MANYREHRVFACDFETTVYDNQERTDVWASCLCELGSSTPILHGSIDETYDYFESLNENIDCFYHNLKFDGNFWLSFLFVVKQFKHAFFPTNEQETEGFFLDDKDIGKETTMQKDNKESPLQENKMGVMPIGKRAMKALEDGQ